MDIQAPTSQLLETRIARRLQGLVLVQAAAEYGWDTTTVDTDRHNTITLKFDTTITYKTRDTPTADEIVVVEPVELSTTVTITATGVTSAQVLISDESTASVNVAYVSPVTQLSWSFELRNYIVGKMCGPWLMPNAQDIYVAAWLESGDKDGPVAGCGIVDAVTHQVWLDLSSYRSSYVHWALEAAARN